jgi:hypothetical protein
MTSASSGGPSGMKRGKPPQRKTYIKRSTKRIKLRRGDPAKRRWASRRDDGYRKLVVATYPCEVEGRMVTPTLRHRCSGRLEFAHVGHAKGVGGYDVAGGLSLCTEAHTAAPWSIHRGEKSFAERFGLDLVARAREIADELGYTAPTETRF